MKKYSLWQLVHENSDRVSAIKAKDTNSKKEVDDWIKKDWLQVASFYRQEDELNADYLQTFQNY